MSLTTLEREFIVIAVTSTCASLIDSALFAQAYRDGVQALEGQA